MDDDHQLDYSIVDCNTQEDTDKHDADYWWLEADNLDSHEANIDCFDLNV